MRNSRVVPKGLNSYSLGIELDNAGKLTRHGTHWQAWFGGEYHDDEVIEAVHKNQTETRGWHTFTSAQIDATLEVSSLIINRYGLVDVLGHDDDIAPRRKQDPGPAFPMESFRARLLGRQEDDEDEEVGYRTTTTLNIRTGPGTHHSKLEGGPLPRNTSLVVLEEQGSWRFVDVLDVVNDVMDMQGWVHGRYIEPVV